MQATTNSRARSAMFNDEVNTINPYKIASLWCRPFKKINVISTILLSQTI